MNQCIGLSPIQELTDLDLSFLINQLSSASGDITDRTIEELLREAENTNSSTSLVQAPRNELISQYIVSSENILPQFNEVKENKSSSNVFMSAIESLSQVTSRIQHEIALKEKETLSSRSELAKPVSLLTTVKNAKENTLTKRKQNPTLPKPPVSRREKLTISVKVPCSVDNREDAKKSSKRLINKPVKSEMLSRTTVDKAYCRPICTTTLKNPPLNPPSSKVALGKKPSGSLLSGRSTAFTRGRGVVESTDSSGDKTVSSRARSVDSTDSNIQSGGHLRLLREENARLQLKIKRLEAQINDKRLQTGAVKKTNIVKNSYQNASNEQTQKTELAPKLDQFQLQLENIQEKYESQLQALTQRCQELEAELRPPVTPVVEVLKSVENLPKLDMGCQTDKEKRDAGCQSYRVEKETPSPESPKVNGQSKNSDNLPKMNSNRANTINFEFNDLDLDNNFITWTENSGKVGSVGAAYKKSQKKIIKEPRIRSQPRGDQHLVTTIRGLQAEVQAKIREIRKLKNELASCKPRQCDKVKGIIRKTTGTQTIGLAASTALPYDPKLFEGYTKMAQENEKLKEELDKLESEISTLRERRVLDLKVLQDKHEEEISTLLEQKLFLANKLDALLARTFR